jgi:hypothetical protein
MDPVVFRENITLNSTIIHFGPPCTPRSQEGYHGIWANLSIYGPADQIDFNTGGACYATLNLSNFIWNYANASYAYHYGQSHFHISLGSGLSSQGLTLAYEKYVGQFRFFSQYWTCNKAANNLCFNYINLKGLNVTPVMTYQYEFGNATEMLNSYQVAHSGGNGSYNYSMPYWTVPFPGGATYANDTWRFTNATSSCIYQNVQRTCYLWFGQSQELFYGEGHSTVSGGGGGGVGTPVACQLSEGEWDVLLVVVPVVIVTILIEMYGITRRKR